MMVELPGIEDADVCAVDAHGDTVVRATETDCRLAARTRAGLLVTGTRIRVSCPRL
ncbi:MAG: hypothetical protein U5N86_01380 [Planctomycetota bacterium]|nr:hypothetical protein [Planctomycetota bacterium]